jgi:hypothetical protein
MASTRVTTYSADEQAMSFAGQMLDSGFEDGEFLTIEMAADDFTAKVGSDGEVARSKSNNRMSTIKVKCLQTSQMNDRLNQLRRLDLAGVNGAGVGVFELVDRSAGGVVVAHADKAWISHAPTIGRGREVGVNEWTLTAAHMELNVVGNPSI